MNKRISMMLLTATLVAVGCATARETAEEVGEDVAEAAREVRSEVERGPTAVAHMVSSQGAAIGTIEIEEEEDGVDLEGHLTGLPTGTHGIHIHENGTCTPPDFESAGAHYNPTSREHGFENAAGPHAGDLRNIEVGADRAAHVDLEAEAVTIRRGPRTLLDANGAALVIHATADDYRTNPSGNSGARIACGVIVRQ